MMLFLGVLILAMVIGAVVSALGWVFNKPVQTFALAIPRTATIVSLILGGVAFLAAAGLAAAKQPKPADAAMVVGTSSIASWFGAWAGTAAGLFFGKLFK